MEGYLSWIENPFPAHLSVGAVLFDKDSKEVCCHHFLEVPQRIQKTDGISGELYTLMRETPKLDENIEIAVKRGLKEEFGAEGKILGYLGSIKANITRADGNSFEKTTLYFLVEKTKFDITERDQDDEEKDSIIEWHPIDFLIREMEKQRKRVRREDLDESSVLLRARDFL